MLKIVRAARLVEAYSGNQVFMQGSIVILTSTLQTAANSHDVVDCRPERQSPTSSPFLCRGSGVDWSWDRMRKRWDVTYHRCPRILPIHEYTIFSRSRTLVVRRSTYFSSSITGTTDANQYGNSAGSSGGSP